MNGLSGQIDVDVTLAEAQVLCLSLRNLVAQHDRQSDEHAGIQAADKTGTSEEDAAAIAAAANIAIDDNLRMLVGASRPHADVDDAD